MTNLLRVTALRAADAGDGGGGSFIAETTKDGDKTVDDKGKGGAELTPEQKATAAALEAAVDDKWSPKLADGQKLDDADLGTFRKLAKEGGFKAGQAQKLVEFDLSRQAARDKAADETFTQQRQSWRASMKTDPEYGGANFDVNTVNVKRAFTKFGSPGLQKFLAGGAGDHPEFIKLFARIGAQLAEDPGIKPGAKPTNGASAEETEMRKMFDKSPELFT